MADSAVVWPTRADDYEMLALIGSGASAEVYRALCKPLNQECAVKKLNLEDHSIGLDELRKEVQVMGTSSDPHLLTYHAAFIAGQYMYLVMPLLVGSCLDIMRSRGKPGIEDEALIAAILRQVTSGLAYLHAHGQIHRDVKAGNVLVREDGTCVLSDFGVSTVMREGGERLAGRQTFVGTPCWMAPEVVDTVVGYDERADIWSLGICAIELATGTAPLARYHPFKVLLMIIQNPAPRLANLTTRSYSRAFHEFVEMCLQKDIKQRPSAEKLLRSPFLRNVRPDRAAKLLAEKFIEPFIMAGGVTAKAKAKPAEGSDVGFDQVNQEWDFSQSDNSSIMNPASVLAEPTSLAPEPATNYFSPESLEPLAPSSLLQAPSSVLQTPSSVLAPALAPAPAPAATAPAPAAAPVPTSPPTELRVYYRLQPKHDGRVFSGMVVLPPSAVLAQLRESLRGDQEGDQRERDRFQQWALTFGESTMACDVVVVGPGLAEETAAAQADGDYDDVVVETNTAQNRYTVKMV